VNNSFHWGGEIIALDQVMDGKTIKAAQHEVATEGHAVIGTVSKANVWSTLSMLPQVLPKPQRDLSPEAERRRALEGVHMVVAQHLVSRVGGGSVAVREFLVVDDRVRDELVAADRAMWPALVERLIDDPGVTGRSFGTAADELHGKGLIWPDTHERLVAYSRHRVLAQQKVAD
jgi:defect-in-organelle-trafficking protein DotB